MNHYDRIRHVAQDINAWVNNPDRNDLTAFCRGMRIKYGVSPAFIKKVLQEDYKAFLDEIEGADE